METLQIIGGFCVGLALQWLYQRVFGDLIREMRSMADAARFAERVRQANHERAEHYSWVRNYHDIHRVRHYSRNMEDLVKRLGGGRVN